MDNDDYYTKTAYNQFNKAKLKANLEKFFNFLKPKYTDLLSLDEIKNLINPKSQTYRGIQTVPINSIIGSEGRYKDFTKKFFPKKEYLRNRWIHIDKLQQKDIILPPVVLYEIGGMYFVRDGNHRISVARMQDSIDIDAEVISLDTDIKFKKNMTKEDLILKLIEYEKANFLEITNFNEIVPYNLNFSYIGSFKEIETHINVHKYFLNEDKEDEISINEAIKLWFIDVFMPIIYVIKEYKVMQKFPKKTEGDLYLWITNHYHYLKEDDKDITYKDAVIDFSNKFSLKSDSILKNIINLFKLEDNDI